MEGFATCIEEFRNQIDLILKDGKVHQEIQLRTDRKTNAPDEPGDKKRRPELVLKSEMQLELGGPETDACGMVLYTSDREKVRNGLVTVIGPDIQDAPQGRMAYGQVVLIEGKPLEKSMYYEIQKAINLSASIPGYMSKRNGMEVWDRISIKAVKRGLNFPQIAETLMDQIRTKLTEITAVEVFFIAGEADAVKQMQAIGEKAEAIWQQLKKQLWSSRGIDLEACSPGGHCGACDDKETCDKIRRISRDYTEMKKEN